MSSGLENKYVIFKLEDEYYGINIDSVIAIEKMENITRIPNSPDYVKGVINLRGEVVTLIDLKAKLNMESSEDSNNSRIIVVSTEEIVAGLIVDSSSEVIEIKPSDIDNPPEDAENGTLIYTNGIGKVNGRLIILLELTKILEY